MAPPADEESDSFKVAIGMLTSLYISAQNSCHIHEQCDPGCSSRLRAQRYWVDSDGNRHEDTVTDVRVEYAATAQSSGSRQDVPTEPRKIPGDAPTMCYMPLERPYQTIRLLRLHGDAYFRADPVEGELVHFAIDALPTFGALSYVWGTGRADRPMLVNGNVFYGTLSLEAGLKKLRAGFDVALGHREKYIWADAICIDQENQDEKAAQIQLMQTIYASAQTVYVDLGGEGRHTIPFKGANCVVDIPPGMGRLDTFTTAAEDPSFSLNYMSAMAALSQPWFTRTWVIQELALARRVCFMIAGQVFSQDDFDAFFSRQAFEQHPERRVKIGLNENATLGFLNYSKMIRIMNMFRDGSQDSLQYLIHTRDFNATEPKDKIFGLLALMQEDDRKAIGPYSQSVDTVFVRFAALQINRTRCISLLELAGLQRSRGGLDPSICLPSWVPDWTAQNSQHTPSLISISRPNTPFAASGSLAADFHLATDFRGLRVQGLLVDEINAIVEIGNPDTAVGYRAMYSRLEATFNKVSGRKKLLGRNRTKSIYSNPDDAFARTLLMDNTFTGPNAISSTSPISDPAVVYKNLLRNLKWGLIPHVHKQKMSPVESFQLHVNATLPRRNFATSKHGYIALVSTFVKPGDIIAVVFGAKTPFVLRQVSGGYELIGDAYVHGIMNGEATQNGDTSGVGILLL